MSSSSSSSSISSSSRSRRRMRINNVEGTGATAAAAAAAALAPIDGWEMNLKRSLAKKLWESPLMNEYRDDFIRLMDATSRHAEALESHIEALKDLKLMVAGLSPVLLMLCMAFLRPGALEGISRWTRLAGAACGLAGAAYIAALVIFSFL